MLRDTGCDGGIEATNSQLIKYGRRKATCQGISKCKDKGDEKALALNIKILMSNLYLKSKKIKRYSSQKAGV
jgi:hypothetical protein